MCLHFGVENSLNIELSEYCQREEDNLSRKRERNQHVLGPAKSRNSYYSANLHNNLPPLPVFNPHPRPGSNAKEEGCVECTAHHPVNSKEQIQTQVPDSSLCIFLI